MPWLSSSSASASFSFADWLWHFSPHRICRLVPPKHPRHRASCPSFGCGTRRTAFKQSNNRIKIRGTFVSLAGCVQQQQPSWIMKRTSYHAHLPVAGVLVTVKDGKFHLRGLHARRHALRLSGGSRAIFLHLENVQLRLLPAPQLPKGAPQVLAFCWVAL